jgi:hypothetical protein
MSETSEVLSDIVADRQSFTGDQVKNLRTGKTFTAEIEEIQEIDLNTELGRDARETVLVLISDRTTAADQSLNDQLQFTRYGQTWKCKILRREDNPAKPQVEFGCMKIVPGKDT